MFNKTILTMCMMGVCLSTYDEQALVEQPAEIEEIAVVVEKINYDKLLNDQKQITCLATNIYFEARSEDELSQVAVAQVTVNRARSRKFPDTICEVVYQAEHSAWYLENHNRLVPKRGRCQFSWYCDGKPDAIRDEKAYEYARMIAKAVYYGEYQMIVSDNTLFYHADYVEPYWAMTMAYHDQIGAHIFYNYY